MNLKSKAAIVGVSLFVMALGLTWSGSMPSAAAQSIQVTAADPPSTTQGTVNLNVLIKGKGFKNGALAKFYVTGTTNPGGIKVNSTKFNSATELVANIDVADTASLSFFDIQVQNSDGRTGKGTELFSVKSKTAACVVPEPVITGGYCFSGAPGCLDTSFGGGTGRVMEVPGMWIYGLAVQNVAGEARILAVGTTNETSDTCFNSTASDWIVTRYRSDGTLDTTFGTGGIIRGGYHASGGSGAFSVVVQPDNKIVVGGDTPFGKISYAAAVARYNEDGTPDLTFGVGGIVNVSYQRHGGWVSGLALQSDGKIVAAACAAYPCHLQVFRLNPNGTLDTSFNGSGQYVYLAAAGTVTAITLQRVQSEERIVIAGQLGSAALFRFRPNGTVDTSFGNAGIVVTDFFGYYDQFLDVAVDSSNRLIAVGEVAFNADSGGMGMARYLPSGSLDTSFGNGGIVTAPGSAMKVAAQSDGYMLVAGGLGTPESWHRMIVYRFAPDGSLDPSFGESGLISEYFTDFRYASGYALFLQADGKFIVGGLARATDGARTYQFGALARFWR